MEIRGFAYQPAALEVAVADTVVWINRDAVAHPVSQQPPGWDSGSLEAQHPWRLVAGKRGDQSYYCTFHPNMRGKLVIR
ncbi:MAG: cupredoxin domain-containing protein [Gemmatimonadales bacterium]